MNAELAHLLRAEGYSSKAIAGMGIAKKIDLLADVNPDSGCRYYTHSQVQLVISIQFYVDLGIPLNTLHNFMDGDGQTINFGDQLDLDRLPDSKAPVQKDSLENKENDSKHYSTSSIEKTEAA